MYSTCSQKAPYSIPWSEGTNIKYGLGDFDIKLYRMAPKPGGKSDNFAITTDDQRKLKLPSMLDDSGSEMNSMYS